MWGQWSISCCMFEFLSGYWLKILNLHVGVKELLNQSGNVKEAKGKNSALFFLRRAQGTIEVKQPIAPATIRLRDTVIVPFVVNGYLHSASRILRNLLLAICIFLLFYFQPQHLMSHAAKYIKLHIQTLWDEGISKSRNPNLVPLNKLI